MKLTVLGSGSKQNCYLIHNEHECLVIEAGVPFKEVKKVLDFKIEKIVGVIISHEHGDHSKYVNQFLDAAIPVILSAGTNDALKSKYKNRFPLLCEHGKRFKMGNFTIMPFDIQHDVNEPLGFLIKHEDSGKILFLTDTFYSDYTFKGLTHVLVEANYCEHILDENIKTGKINSTRGNRTRTSHMSLNTCKELLSANDLTGVINIVLLHLSDQNSDEQRFKQEIIEHTGKLVYVARKGLEIPLLKTGF